MNQKDINYAIRTKRLRLTFDRFLTHFSRITSLELLSAFIAINMHSNNKDSIIYLVSLIISFLGLCFIYYKWTQLSFTVYKVSLKRSEIYLALDKLCNSNGWHFKEQRFKTSLLKPNDFEGGEISIDSDSNVITVIIVNNELYINCIPVIGGNNNIGKWNPEKINNEIISINN